MFNLVLWNYEVLIVLIIQAIFTILIFISMIFIYTYRTWYLSIDIDIESEILI